MDYLAAIRDADPHLALHLAQEWSKKEPENAKAWFCFGTCVLNQGDYKRSIDLLSEALRLNPSYDKALCNLGSAYCSLKQYATAAPLFEQAYKFARDSEVSAIVLPKLVDCYICAGDFKSASEWLPKLYLVDEEMALMLEGKIVRAIIPGERKSFWRKLKWW